MLAGIWQRQRQKASLSSQSRWVCHLCLWLVLPVSPGGSFRSLSLFLEGSPSLPLLPSLLFLQEEARRASGQGRSQDDLSLSRFTGGRNPGAGGAETHGPRCLRARHLHLSASGPRSVKRRQDRHLPGQCLSEVARPHGVAAPTSGETRASCTPKRSRHPLVSIREYFLTRWSCNSLRPEFWLFFSEPKPNKRIGLGPRPTPRVSLSASHSVSVPSRGAGALGSV